MHVGKISKVSFRNRPNLKGVCKIGLTFGGHQYLILTLLQVDVDELEDLAASQEVKAMPTFAFFKGGKKLESFAGANEARIRETIEKLLAA